MSTALEGVRVIDFGQYIAGPLTGLLLADQGADVIRVDPPGGPLWDTPANATWNRGKRSIALDLKRRSDLDIARRLVASADVVVENFRPGVMDRLGLGPREATRDAPRLIYCSLPGFAADDPRASMPAWEGVVAAATDTYRPPRGQPDAPPAYTALPIASTFAAFIGAVSIAAALFSRERDGRGQRIEVPLFDAMFAAIGANGLIQNGAGGGGRPNDFTGGIFECSDGRWVQVALAKPGFQRRFAEAAGVADLGIDPHRLTHDREHRDALAQLLPAMFKRRTADEWEQLGAAADVPLIKIRSSAEWLETEHALESGAVVELDDPRYGPMLQPNSPIRLSAAGDVDRRPAAELDADREEVLAELERVQATPAADELPPARRAALEGVKVIDLSQVLAGPMAGRTLAEFGADVIKINAPDEQGAGIRLSVHRYHTDVNRGKRTMLLDLKSPDGLDVFWTLAGGADVVLHNFREAALDRLGIGYEEARRRDPRMIYQGVSAYGHPGPWGDRPGYEPFGQAPTGMSERMGGDGRPIGQPFAVNDYGTGLMAAYATTLALFQRERTGEGQRGEAALAFTGTMLQSPFLHSFEGKRWDEPRGPQSRGSGPLQRLYRAADGWLFLAARDSELAAVAAVDGLDGVDALRGAKLEAELERRFGERRADEWCEALVEAGVGAHRLVGVGELMRDPWVVAHGLSVTRVHDSGEEITTVGPAARLSHTPAVAGRPAPTPGADASEILADAGLEDALGRLSDSGAVLVAAADGSAVQQP